MLSLVEPRRDATQELVNLVELGKVSDRDGAREALERLYRERALQPIRGKAWPEDLWDKELATVYILAKYILGVKVSESFRKIFYMEETLEEAVELLTSDKEDEEVKRWVLFLLGGAVDSNTIARLLRIQATKVVFGLSDDDTMARLLRRLATIFPEEQNSVRKYARYYIALRTAQMIALHKVRNRIEKEAFKQALAARIELPKVLPDDDYIKYIALNVFNVPKKVVEKVFAKENLTKRGKPRGGQPRVHSSSPKG
jgi:hypothetical protein